MQDINASILNRSNRKFWYVKYQVLFENEIVQKYEESTRVLKSEKKLKYMQTKYLPAWIASKKNKLSVKQVKSKKLKFKGKKSKVKSKMRLRFMELTGR